MSLHDPIADLLTRIRNAIKAKMATVAIPHSVLKTNIVKILKEEGYIKDFSISEKNKIKTLVVSLKYKGRFSTIKNLKQISKPSLRVYAEAINLPHVLNGLGIAIVSTSKGVITNKQALKLNLGGEVIAYIY